MPVFLKVMALVFITVVAVVSAVVWKTQSLILSDKVAFISDSAARQIAPIKRLVQAELNQERSRLVDFANRRTASGAGRARQFGIFDVIAMMQPLDPASEKATQWTPAWVEKGPQANTESWSPGHELTLLKSLPLAKVRDGETIWVRVSDAKGSPLYAMLVAVEIQPASNSATHDASGPGAPLPEAVPGTQAPLPPPTSASGRAIVVGFLSTDPLAGVVEDSIGSLSTVYIVDDRGYVAAHTNRNYLGSLFSEDPLVEEIMKGQKISGTGKFEDLESLPILGHFERVEHTNLFAVSTTPMGTMSALLDAHLKTALTTGFGVGVICLFLAALVGLGISRPLRGAVEAIKALGRGAGDARIQAASSNDEVGELTRLLSETSPTAFALRPELVAAARQPKGDIAIESEHGPSRPFSTENSASALDQFIEATPERLAAERRAAFGAFAEGLGHAVREPLLAVLANAKLVRGKAADQEIAEHANTIESEVRQAKNVIERLQGFALEDGEFTSADKMDLGDIVRSALENMRADFALAEIDVQRGIDAVPVIRGAGAQIEEALTYIFDNAIEAMKSAAVKTLKVQLEYLGDHIFLTVTDTGVGMSREVKARAFEPFFKNFEGAKRQGLGLSFVGGVMKRHGGHCMLESTTGKGTSIVLKFDVTGEEKRAFFESKKEAPFVTASAPLQEPLSVEATESPLETLEFLADGDEDEVFTSIDIGQAGIDIKDAPKGEFKVNIRRPRPRA